MMKPKYKIGDTVTIKEVRERNSGDYRFSFPDRMVEEYGGKSLRIVRVEAKDYASPKDVPDDGYKYKLEGNNWSWASSMFEDSSEDLSLETSIDNNLDAFIAKKRCPRLDFTL